MRTVSQAFHASAVAAMAVLALACSGRANTAPPASGDDAGATSPDSGGATVDSGPATPVPTDSGTDDAASTFCVNDPGCVAPGAQCNGSSVVTCMLGAQGCLVATTTTACPVDETCASSGIVAACVCVASTTCSSTGTFCEGAGTIVTCAPDSNGCLAATEKTCGPNETCDPGSPSCVCNVTPCTAAGTSCASATSTLTCNVDPNGCLVGDTAMCPGAETCSGTAPSAKCG